MKDIQTTLEKLVAFAHARGLIEKEDLPYARNLLLDAMMLEAPAPVDAYETQNDDLPPTATPLLDALCDDAVARGLIPAEPTIHRELFSARLMGLLTPPPSVLAERFRRIEAEQGARAATDWLYALCRDNNYIRVDDIARNRILKVDSPVGELVITINLSKPEKDPKTIALERSLPQSGYPACQLCVENTGYAGRLNHPARQNHRMIPLTLAGNSWHMQYSPYLYYDEHCIALNDRHIPMRIHQATFEAMFDFVDRFPHYFIGSNADLPIVGGSILSHDHFQGGRQRFPVTNAPIAKRLISDRGLESGIVQWPLSTVRLMSKDRAALTAQAVELLAAWREWSDEEHGILANTDAPHNTVTPTLRSDHGRYVLDLILRNNRTSAEHPLGIFHPHDDLHHIKRENIGLIEAMGMFILPGRLLAELEKVGAALSTEKLPAWDAGSDMAKHLPWLTDIRARRGMIATVNVQRVLDEELAVKCARVLTDCGVYPQNEKALAAMARFLDTVGLHPDKE